MTTYRKIAAYRSSKQYRASGVYTTPALSRSYRVPLKSASAQALHKRAAWGDASTISASRVAAWRVASRRNVATRAAWSRASHRSPELSLLWSRGITRHSLTRLAWRAPLPVLLDNTAAWGKAVSMDVQMVTGWLAPAALFAAASAEWSMISHRSVADYYRSSSAYRRPWRYVDRPARIALNTYSAANWGASEQKINNQQLPWGGGFAVWGTDRPIDWDSDISPMPDKQPPPEPSVEEVYIMATDLTVKELATGAPLEVDQVSMRLDVDSFAWRLSMRVLNEASMQRMMPPAEIEVMTMGWRWVFVVESYTSLRELGRTYTVRASSLTRKLDAPWVAPLSHAAAAGTFKQVAESLLPSGWSIEWHGVDDFSLPALALSFNDKTPIVALGEMLSAIGAVMQPDRASKVLHVQPRYKYAPWEYYAPATTPDAIIHGSMITKESGEYRPGVLNNGVWVSGTTADGVQVEAVRYGTDGMPFAADVYHELIVSDVAARQRAKHVLSASGAKLLTSVETFITDEQVSPGLILPGMFVELQGGDVRRGLCLDVSLSGLGEPRMTQVVTLEVSDDSEYN